MIDMPPIECPTSTTGPRGAVASSTAYRSSPVCSIVALAGSLRPDRPWLRWSQNTVRSRPRRSRRW
jgi:hypothetical protein